MSTQKLVRKVSRTGVHKIVKKDLEEVVLQVAERTGVMPHTIRNTALAYGLIVIMSGGRVPYNDLEFERLLERVRHMARFDGGGKP